MSTKTNHEIINLLRDRIRLTPRAFLYNLSPVPVHLPNDIVYVRTLDEDGCFWVAINYPKCSPVILEAPFPVKLRFYSKNVDFFIEAEGVAQCNGLVTEHNNMLLLKVVPFSVEVTEFEKSSIHWLLLLKRYINLALEKIDHLLPPKKENLYSCDESSSTRRVA